MMTRFLTSTTLGLTMTVGLLYLMQTLIDSGNNVLTDTIEHDVLDWIMLPPDVSPPLVNEKPDPLPEPKIPPVSRVPMSDETSGQVVSVRIPRQSPPGDGTRLRIYGYSDGPLVNIVRIQPVYPARAKQRGLEGYVTIEFDVTAEGAVINAVVLDSSHPVFEQAAINAANRFRFKPRVVDGIPVGSTGMRNRFRFEMEE